MPEVEPRKEIKWISINITTRAKRSRLRCLVPTPRQAESRMRVKINSRCRDVDLQLSFTRPTQTKARVKRDAFVRWNANLFDYRWLTNQFKLFSFLSFLETTPTRELKISLIVTKQPCLWTTKITFNCIDTCVLLKNMPYSLNLWETSSGTRVVYFLLYPVTTRWWCHVPLFRGILRAQSVNYAVSWMYVFFPRVKTIFYPSKITFVPLLHRVISSLYLAY